MADRIQAVPQGGADDPARREWARKVLANLGIGLARDESGFYRPMAQRQRPEPEDQEDEALPVARRRRCAKSRTTSLQLSLFP